MQQWLVVVHLENMKWTKELFVHLLALTVLNDFIILSSCGNRIQLQRFDSGSDLLEMSVRESHY